MAMVLPLEQELQDDHKRALDGIFDLLKAIDDRDVQRAREIVAFIDLASGPHWRWEEEALYPALRQFSDELVDGLMTEHDTYIDAVAELSLLFERQDVADTNGGVGSAVGRLASRLRRKSLTQEDWDRARDLTRHLIYHLATCDGLIMWTEILDEEYKRAIRQAIFTARREGIPLLEWARKLR